MKSKLFIVFTMVVLFISGCRSSEKKEEVVQDANNYAEYNEELETTSSNTVLSDDLLYREYSLGENFNAGEIFSGDILVSRLPEPVGRACIVPEKAERMITAVDCTICSKRQILRLPLNLTPLL